MLCREVFFPRIPSWPRFSARRTASQLDPWTTVLWLDVGYCFLVLTIHVFVRDYSLVPIRNHVHTWYTKIIGRGRLAFTFISFLDWIDCWVHHRLRYYKYNQIPWNAIRYPAQTKFTHWVSAVNANTELWTTPNSLGNYYCTIHVHVKVNLNYNARDFQWIKHCYSNNFLTHPLIYIS